ncbi:MAG: hypothetical protein AAGK14_13445 [Verrucomicrobiota bacterium]
MNAMPTSWKRRLRLAGIGLILAALCLSLLALWSIRQNNQSAADPTPEKETSPVDSGATVLDPQEGRESDILIMVEDEGSVSTLTVTVVNWPLIVLFGLGGGLILLSLIRKSI